MNRKLKSQMYGFVASDIEIYFPDDEIQNHFVASKLLCSNCGSYWHTSLLECYFCGELNWYLYTCTSCGRKYSITNSSIKCECKNQNSKLIKACENQNCPTNTREEIESIAKRQGGVFDLKSSFNLSLNYCVKCGNNSNFYQIFKVFLHEDGDLKEFIKKNSVEKNDIIIFKNKSNSKITYDFLKLDDTNSSFSPTYPYNNMAKVIDGIFGGDKNN